MHARFVVACLFALMSVVPLADGAAGRSTITFTVDSTADAVDAAPGDGRCRTAAGACTVRAAFNEVSATRTDGTAILISIPPGEYRLTIDPVATTAGDPLGGDLDLRPSSAPPPVWIYGAGAGMTVIQQRRASRVIEVQTGAAVTIANLTIRGGRDTTIGGGGILAFNRSPEPPGALTLRSVEIVDNSTTDSGGGVYVTSRLVVIDSQIHDNSARNGGGVAIRSTSASIRSTRINDNTARSGGAVFADSVTSLSFTLSKMNNNVAAPDTPGTTGSGGGIYMQSTVPGAPRSEVSMLYTTIKGNAAGQGAGVRTLARARITIDSSLLAANTSASGAAIYSSGTGISELIVVNSTLSGNSADDGAAIWDTGGNVTLRSSTLAANSSTDGGALTFARVGSILRITGTILANQPADRNCFFRAGGRFTELGQNIDSGTSCGFGAPSRSSTDPRLRDLADNGGANDTHGLRDGSPAIDTYTAGVCPPLDQRAYTRPAGARCDIGSFERGGEPTLTIPLLLLIDSGVIGGGIRFTPAGARTTSLRGGDFRPCGPGKAQSFRAVGGSFELNDAHVATRGLLLFRRGQKVVRLGNLLVLLDGRTGSVISLIGPGQRGLRLFEIRDVRYGQGTAHGRLLLSAAAARTLNRLLGMSGFRAAMPCGQLDLRVSLGRNAGPPPPVPPEPLPPAPPPPPPPPPPPQAQTFTLTVSVQPSGGGHLTGTGIDCPSDCTESYTAGTSVTLSANPASGYELDDWDGACTGSSETCTFTMDSDKFATANFESSQAACNDGKDNDGDGAVDYPADKGCSSKNDDSEK
jgi:hypothetical protein